MTEVEQLKALLERVLDIYGHKSVDIKHSPTSIKATELKSEIRKQLNKEK